MIKTYDAKSVIIMYGGRKITGFPDGTFISIEPNSELFTKTVGADGEVSRGKNNDYTSVVSITLQQTSESNDYLSALMREDRIFGTGVRPLQINDLRGTTLHYWQEAWIQAKPGEEMGKEVSEREWTLDTGQPTAAENIGGNS